jgi:hypothetical protein
MPGPNTDRRFSANGFAWLWKGLGDLGFVVGVDTGSGDDPKLDLCPLE